MHMGRQHNIDRGGNIFTGILGGAVYGTGDTILRRHGGSAGKGTNPVAAMIRSAHKKRMKKWRPAPERRMIMGDDTDEKGI
jgi:hypothetical protein